MQRSTLLLAILVPLAVAGCGEPEDSRPGQPVKHRRAAFSSMLKAFEPMGKQLRDGRYDADKFLAYAKTLNEAKDAPWQYFGADTNYPPTHATGRVWSEPARFEADRQSFFKATASLLQAAESRDEKIVKQAYETVHDSCRTCHKAFKD